MSRSALTLIIVVVILVGALFFLSGRAHVRPTGHVERAVPLANLT